MKDGARGVLLLLAGCALSLLFGCRGGAVPTPSATATQPSPVATTMPTPVATMMPSPQATETATAAATLEPTAIPSVQATATPPASPTASVDEVLVRETTLSILSYPYEPYLEQTLDEATGFAYLWLDRSAYEQPPPEAVALRPFKAVILENRYLRLTILPELGGRLYQCTFKPTGESIFYQNRVLKPTQWGPLSRERNWWLAAGGMEWAFPVNEHGYQWGIPWSYSIERAGDDAKVVLWDTEEARLRARVEIALAPDCAYFTVRPQAENLTDSSARVQFWTNAMVTLGSHSLSPSTEFVYPIAQVLVHSAGPDAGLPGERSMISWPVWEGRDLSRYENWGDWLGFFVPQVSSEFVGGYNHDTDLGVVRTFSREEAPGVKLFAWGLGSPLVSEYTDDGSQYFEIWGGPNLTFWLEDDIVLQPGDSVGWTEHWYPFKGIGGLDYANRQAAVSLRLDQGSLKVGMATSAPRGGVMVLRSAQEELFRQQVSVSPEDPYLTAVPVPSGLTPENRISFSFLTAGGEVVASYEVSLRDLER